jgi:predicted ATPase
MTHRVLIEELLEAGIRSHSTLTSSVNQTVFYSVNCLFSLFPGIFVLGEIPAPCGGSTMDLLERDHCFDQLSALLRTATTGNGRTVLISGEAGIGKTALVEQFVSQHASAARRLWGACEALFTPRPLGPLYDIATQAGGSLSTLMGRDAERPALFSAFLDELQQSSLPTIVVFEDVHWADEATLDLIKFLGRRIPHLPVLFLVTYRDDELSRDHPLRSVIGDLPGTAVVRLRLTPLSEHAVTSLANLAHRSAEQLYAVTGGNPFFVTEVLASDTDGVPLMVRDSAAGCRPASSRTAS